MAKLVILSIVIVSMAVPIALSARPSPQRALRRAQWLVVAFVFVWAAMCLLWYPQLQPLQ